MGPFGGQRQRDRVAGLVIGTLLGILALCDVRAMGAVSHLKLKRIYSLAYGYNPGQNGSFATNNVLLPGEHIRALDGWGVYLSQKCVICLAQLKADGFHKRVWIHGPGLRNSSAEGCYAQLTDDGDFNMYYGVGTFAASIIKHPWALHGVSSKVGYELTFIKDSAEWHHHMNLELRHYNWKVQQVTLWQDILSIVD